MDKNTLKNLEKFNLKFLFLPPNTTSILQPLDVGVNANFKKNIKKKHINWLINCYSLGIVAKDISIHSRRNTFIKFIIESFDEISSECVKKSFTNSEIGVNNLTPHWNNKFSKTLPSINKILNF